jgi:hypothetical protein
MSLDEVAETLNPAQYNRLIDVDEAVKEKIIAAYTASVFKQFNGKKEKLEFNEFGILFLLDKLLNGNKMTQDEAVSGAELAQKSLSDFQTINFNLMLLRKMGASFWVSFMGRKIIEKNAAAVEDIIFEEVLKELKTLLIKMEI